MGWAVRAGENAGELILVTIYIVIQVALTFVSLCSRDESSVLFMVILCLFLASYVRTFATDAGTANDKNTARMKLYMDEYAHDSNSNNNNDIDNLGIRTCRPCNAPKRERVHHCSVCGTCVIRYDHHCPWVGNCVGWLNVRYFLQVLFYGAGTILYSGIVVTKFLLYVVEQRQQRGHRPDVRVELVAFGCAIFGSIFAFTVFAVLARLLAFQCFLIAKDRTTLEHVSNARPGSPGARSYDRGSSFRNIRAVLGNNPLRWFLPI